MGTMKFVHPEKQTGFKIRKWKNIPTLKRDNFIVLNDLNVTGDAPKEFIKVYKYGDAPKSTPDRWPFYIAKTGHKWYPNESVTEHLLTRIGQCFGFKMAESKLLLISGQIRFLSKHFHSKKQLLVHGAEIYAGYLQDKEIVEEIENRNLSRDLFTLQFTKDAIEEVLSENSNEIFESFIKMIIFDSIVGNNDRHFYNWGVIRHIEGNHPPYFSKIYDTARGLLWNESEEKIDSLILNRSNLEVFIKKYAKGAKPKTGWENEKNINHFNLTELIYKNEYGISKEQIHEILHKGNLLNCFDVIDNEFNGLISKNRVLIIKRCLEARFNKLIQITSGRVEI